MDTIIFVLVRYNINIIYIILEQ